MLVGRGARHSQAPHPLSHTTPPTHHPTTPITPQNPKLAFQQKAVDEQVELLNLQKRLDSFGLIDDAGLAKAFGLTKAFRLTKALGLIQHFGLTKAFGHAKAFGHTKSFAIIKVFGLITNDFGLT